MSIEYRLGKPARVRVELKRKFNDPDKNFKEMLHEFRRQMTKSGIMHDFKDHQFYESKSEKIRKAKRSSQKKRLMDSLTQKILAGERVMGHGAMVKKIMANIKKEKEKKEKKRNHNNYRHHDDNRRDYHDE
jgi:ribosomal protein S21